MMKTIWSSDSIPTEDWKYRNLARVWLPVYYLIAIVSGIVATLQGSTFLNRLFTDNDIDMFGGTLTMVSIACLIGVAFPRLWRLEIVATIAIVGILAAYGATILTNPYSPTPNTFSVLMLTLGLPFLLFRLNLLGEELKERRVK